jgi:ABC-type antimicrobial peptide transport system permease subunit
VSSDVLVTNIKTGSEQVDRQLFTEHMMACLSAAFGLLALALAAVGVYGVLAYSVTRRTGEIAIRISLGALPRENTRLILADGLAPAAAGAVVGLLASYAVMRLMTAFLYGVQALDPLTYGVATVVLLAIAALACYVPARRAARVDPMVALRFE